MRVVIETFGTLLTFLSVVLISNGIAILGKGDPKLNCRGHLDEAYANYAFYANEVLSLAPILVAGRLISYVVARTVFYFSSDAPSTADNLFSIVFHSYISCLACMATYELHSDVELRWKGSTTASQMYMLLFVLDNTIHVPFQGAKATPTGKNMSVIAHHILSNLCYCVSLASGHMHFWACLAGVSEITNPSLSIVFIMKECGCDKGAIMGRLFKLASLILWLGFVLFRMILLPAWLLEFATDHYFNYSVVVCVSTLFERLIFVAVIVILLALNTFWFIPITQGLWRTMAAKPTRQAGGGSPPRSSKRSSRGKQRKETFTEKRGKFSRAQGASSGAESFLIAMVLMGGTMALRGGFHGWYGALQVPAASLLLQLAVMSPICRNMILIYCFSMKLGPATMRNAALGFAQCVRPGGKPTSTHCLNMFHLSAPLTGFIWFCSASVVLTLGPFTSFVRLFYPEHSTGVNSGRFLRLYWLFLRHPLAVQGEGPSNGDGLSAICSSESLIYPITQKTLKQGPAEIEYWMSRNGMAFEGKPRLRDMFHDKLFCHRFFRSHGVGCPRLVAEVEGHQLLKLHTPKAEATMKLIWKPRYSTMGLGVEHFVGWEEEASNKSGEWAPSSDPYLIEEHIQSSEYDHSEWYRCTTLWEFEEEAPKTGYLWRMRNPRGDMRVQTDIMGGAYCITSQYEPTIGPKTGGTSFDPRTGESLPLDPDVHAALTTGIGQMCKMHQSLGKEIYSVGWDVMIRGRTPVFIEFNIGNGFYVADHTVEECEQMADFFSRQFHARWRAQLLDFDPEAADDHGSNGSNGEAKSSATASGRRSRSPAAKKKKKG